MSDIFISYSRHSEAIARSLANDIKELGNTVWFDQELSGGQVWWEQILTRIRHCQVFVFVMDSNSLNSTACKREYGYAADLCKPILPVRVAEDIATNLLPPALSQIHFVDYRKQDRDAALRLARALTTVPPPKPLPDPLPIPPEVPISYLSSLAEKIETPSPLSHEEQGALVVELKRSLRDPETMNDGRALLGRLRKRRDLLASIAEEIDELLKSAQKPPPSRFSSPEPVSPDLSRWRSWWLAHKGAVYHGLFYLFLAYGIGDGIIALDKGWRSDDHPIEVLVSFAIAFACRAAAARDYRERLQNGSTRVL